MHIDIRTTGSPPPEFTRVEGTWPEGVRFHVPLFSGRGEIRGTPAPGSEGRYEIRIAIRNDWGTDSGVLALVVLPATTDGGVTTGTTGTSPPAG
ncbi:MAG: hypothetical protein KatS3mg010_1463 [Acidimicrobiia bacterium]|nr:MAG: hypothetical protein KatS3mg010_1463 [Acidimicrobiia bacterium]